MVQRKSLHEPMLGWVPCEHARADMDCPTDSCGGRVAVQVCKHCIVGNYASDLPAHIDETTLGICSIPVDEGDATSDFWHRLWPCPSVQAQTMPSGYFLQVTKVPGIIALVRIYRFSELALGGENGFALAAKRLQHLAKEVIMAPGAAPLTSTQLLALSGDEAQLGAAYAAAETNDELVDLLVALFEELGYPKPSTEQQVRKWVRKLSSRNN